MSISSISNSYLAALSGQYYNPYVNTNNNNIDSTSNSNLKKVNTISSDGDTFQLSGATAPTIISASDVYSNMDANGDGTVSESEFVSTRPDDVTEEMAANLYNSFDTDSSGSLTETEFETAMNNASSPATDSSTRSYSNSDTVDPLLSVLDNLYSSMDTDGDGTVSESELSAALSSAVNSTTSTDTTSSSQASASDDLYSIMDTDGDGTVSESEFSSVISALIKDLTADGAGSNGANLQASSNTPGPSPVPFVDNETNVVGTPANSTEKV
jgi:Ca2+-binding EF-hand superfamily protein